MEVNNTKKDIASNLSELFVENVKFQIERQGSNQSKLAAAIGMKQSHLNKYLTGGSSPGLEIVARVAAGLGLHPWELLRPPTTGQLQESGPKLVDPDASRLAILGNLVSRLSVLNEDELRFIEPALTLAEDMRVSTQPQKLKNNKV